LEANTTSGAQDWRRPFFIVWTGQAFSLVGSALVRFALIWWLTEETGSATTLATATLVSLLPFIFLGPFVGTLVDRWNRRWLMIVSDALIAFFTAVMAYLYWLGIAQVWHVYVILFLRSLGGTFQDPAMRATTSLMAPPDQLTRVNGMNETLQGIVNIVSPPMGALLLEVLEVQGTLAIDVITAVIAITPLFLIHIPQPTTAAFGHGVASGQATPSGTEGVLSKAAGLLDTWRSVIRETVDGFLYIRSWRGLFFLLIVLALVRFFTGPPMSLLPLLVTQHYGGGALELGWINSANGFGFVAGGLILSLWGGFKRRTFTAVLGLVGIGLGNIAFGLVPSTAFGLALAAMFLRTMMVPIIRGTIISIFQSAATPEMQGRMFTLLLSATSVMVPLGLAIAGPLADWFGVRPLFLLSGGGCVLLALIWVFSPTVLYLEDHPNRKTGDGSVSAVHPVLDVPDPASPVVGGLPE
jgi:DHA3 family macrolide efflux protein-like MFS transporter